MADTPNEMCKEKRFYLHLVNGIPCLKRGHAYYHQIMAAHGKSVTESPFSSTKKSSSSSKPKPPKKPKKHTCPICLDEINDNTQFCEGNCKSWIHRGCSGLLKPGLTLAKKIFCGIIPLVVLFFNLVKFLR